MKTPKQILVEARELLSDPTKWTKGMLAKDANGAYARTRSPDATCWCSMGALYAVVDSPHSPMLTRALEALKTALNGDEVDAMNDDPETTHEDVLNVFDRAIAELGPPWQS